MNKLAACALLLLTAVPCLASEEGWRARVEAMSALIVTSDQLDTQNGNRKNDKLEAQTKLDKRLALIPTLDISYRKDAYEYYLATPYRSTEFPLALGVTHYGEDGSRLDASVRSALMAEVWRNPYLLDENREPTRLWNAAAAIDWRHIRATPLGLDADFSFQHPQKDDIAKDEEKLDRKGRIWKGDLRGDFNPGQGMFVSTWAGYEEGKLKGSAASWAGPRAGVSYSKREDNFALDATLSAVYRTYRERDPVLLKKRQEGDVGLSTLLTWQSPGGYKPLFCDVLMAFKYRDSSISFYDAKTFVVGVGAGLRL